MVEGVVQDLAFGYVPNSPAELRWAAEWKHARTDLIALVVGTRVASAAIVYFSRDSGLVGFKVLVRAARCSRDCCAPR